LAFSGKRWAYLRYVRTTLLACAPDLKQTVSTSASQTSEALDAALAFNYRATHREFSPTL